jgi:rhamnogalacturonyl hydrolase YesR
MKRQLALLVSLLTVVTSLGCSSNTPTERNGSPLTSAEAVKSRMLKTFQYQITEQGKKKPDSGWIRAAFYTGVMSAYHCTKDPVYLDQAMDWAANQGKWAPYPGKDFRFADDYANAQVYAELYEIKKDPTMIAASRANFDRIIANPKPGRDDWWWCDALYMGPPAFVRMSAVTGDPKYTNYSDQMYWDATDFLYRPNHQLFYRDKNYFHSKTKNGFPVFWSRGNGWVHAGLARILQYLPENHPSRGKYVELFRDMSAKLIALQQPDGLWRSSLLDPAEFPLPETSGTAFFTFGLAWGINNGLLDRAEYLPHVLRGYAGLTALVDDAGKLTHVQRVAGAPGKVNPPDTHEYAVGAFLQASCEILKLKPTAREEAAAFSNYTPPTNPATRPTQTAATLTPAPLTRSTGVPPVSVTTDPPDTPISQTRTPEHRGTGLQPVLFLFQDRPTKLNFDFGTKSTLAPGHTLIEATTPFSPESRAGWLDSPKLETRDRRIPNPLLRDYVFGRSPATLRLSLPPGTYRLTLTTGDMAFGNHPLQASLANLPDVKLPLLRPNAAEFLTLSVAFHLREDYLDLKLDSPENNWVLNALTIEPADAPEKPAVTSQQFERTLTNTWPDQLPPDGIQPHLDQFRKDLAAAPAVKPTNLTRADYLKLIAGNVDFFKQHQDARGAIIDPHRKVEFQYSTPCFALAAATLVAHADRSDLLEPAAKAMDRATQDLHDNKAATGHDDFYPPVLAHALPLLKPRVAPERAARWEENLRTFDPFKIYRGQPPGGGNWNIVAASGEALLHLMGIRENPAFVEHSFAAQGSTFDNPFGLYTEGPMPYDHFPRLWAADAVVAAGYKGKHTEPLAEQLRRAAITSLFMQSPTGELPTGGRSSHHQWNEAEQCVTYEIFANHYAKAGDPQLASVFKRAARLALSSIQRWQRPSGELQVLKNFIDPKDFFAYESYTSHSQYNLLTVAMLSMAYHRAEPTEQLKELPTPADVGGFVLDLSAVLHKVFANAAGTYIEIDTGADPHYNATGLLRIHRAGLNPQLGPSDALVAHPVSKYPEDLPRIAAVVGAQWQLPDGSPQRLAQFVGKSFASPGDKLVIDSVSLTDVRPSPGDVSFTLTYKGNFTGPSTVVERYAVTPGRVTLATELTGYTGPLAMTYPALADDGRSKPGLSTTDRSTLHLTHDNTRITVTSPDATSVTLPETLHPSRNGLFRLATFHQPPGSKASLTISLDPLK